MVEVAALIVLFSIASGYCIILIFVPLVGGALTSAIGCLERPRSWPVVVFGLHVVVLGYVFGERALREQRLELQDQSREQAKEEAVRQQRLRTELEALLERKDLPAPRAFVQEHRELRRAGIPLSTVLCPRDHAEPDMPLLHLLIERGAPQGGDLLVEASKCTLATFRTMTGLGIPSTAVSSSGLKPMMVATDPVKITTATG
ncbi:MAG: hypothetical protein JWN04_5932 [Myxococcaceae bacterium]|nr:hypothetical protein [Myxococcaceae bacterium]